MASAFVMVGMAPAPSEAGEIDGGDFGPNTLTTSFDGLALPQTGNTTPFVIDGHTITTDDGSFRYLDNRFCVQNQCIGNNTAAGFIDIVLSSPQTRAGAFATGVSRGWTIRADFFDASDALLGSVVLENPSGPAAVFAGWEDQDGIARIRFNDLRGNNTIALLDELKVELDDPLPSRPIGIDDFGPNKQTTTFDGLGLPQTGNTTPFVIDGHTITTDDGFFRYLDSPVCFENECITNNTAAGFIDIVLSSPQTRAGAYATGISRGWMVRADFFDESDVVLGSVLLENPSGPAPVFAGWEDPGGIARIRFTDLLGNSTVAAVDNLCVEVDAPAVSIQTVISFGRQAALPDDEMLGGATANVGELFNIDTGSLAAAPVATAIVPTDLDAGHILPNGNVLFSSDTYTFGLPGLPIITPGDIVEYDLVSGSFSIFFPASNFVGLGNVDALSILPNGNLILSTKGGGNLPGLGSFQDGDVVEWDASAGTASLFLAEGDIFTFGANNDVDALHAVDEDTILISPRTDGGGTIGAGLPYSADSADLFEIDAVTGDAIRVLDGENLWDSGNTRQLDAAVLIEVEQ